MKLISICLVLFLFLSGCTQQSTKYVEFAKCLSEKGAKMYGAYWCPHCQQQKKDFGSGWEFVTYVECSPAGKPEVQLTVCSDAKIKGYPTWVFADDSKITGEATFEELSQKTSCPLPSN